MTQVIWSIDDDLAALDRRGWVLEGNPAGPGLVPVEAERTGHELTDRVLHDCDYYELSVQWSDVVADLSLAATLHPDTDPTGLDAKAQAAIITARLVPERVKWVAGTGWVLHEDLT